MRPLPLLVLTAGLLLMPTRLLAQTEEIQQEIETKLWFERILEQIQAATGVPPLVGLTTLLAVLLAIGTVIWLWKSRRKRLD